MTKNEAVALDFYGKAFVRMPRTIYDMMGDEKPDIRKKGRLLGFLFGRCYYEDGYADLGGHRVSCRRGEYVGSKAGIAKLLDMSQTTVHRLLERLEKEQLITIETIRGGSRIRVLGYGKVTSPREFAKRKTTPKSEKTTKTAEERLVEEKELRKKLGRKDPVY